MSATNRTCLDGTVTQRAMNDYYRTPGWVTRAVLPYLPPCDRIGELVIDAGSGDGAIAVELPYRKDRIVCVDNDPDMVRACTAAGFFSQAMNWDEFCATEPKARFVIANPPYSEALEFIKLALEIIKPLNGCAAFLLRLNFLEGQARADFHRRYPAHVLVLPRRPSFTGTRTDATGYAWLLWGSNKGAVKPIVPNRWDILDVEPTERVRKTTL